MNYTEEELKVAEIIKRLLKGGLIKIGVNISQEEAEKGDGIWNVTKAYAVIEGEYIELDEGSVDLVEYQ